MKPTRTIAIGERGLRVGALRAFAWSRGGTRLWTLTSTIVAPRKGLRHSEMPSVLSLFRVDDQGGALHPESSIDVPACSLPALASTDANEAVLMSSLGAMRFGVHGTDLRCIAHLSSSEARGAMRAHAWLRHAPFQLLEGLAGTCFNVSANGAYAIERSQTTSRLLVRRVSDDTVLGESPEPFTMASAACIDHRGEIALILVHGKVARWDVRTGKTNTLDASGEGLLISGGGLLAINTEEDVFAIHGERIALHRLSTGALLHATRYEPLGSSHVSQDLSRAATLTQGNLVTFSRHEGAWKVEQSIRAPRHVLHCGEHALLVRDEGEHAHVDVVNRRGEFIASLRLPSPVLEALAITGLAPATEAPASFANFVASKKTPASGATRSAIFALSTGELAYVTNLGSEPHVAIWNTKRKYAHSLAFSAERGLVLAAHGLKGGRGKGGRIAPPFETADGISLWSLDGRCLFNGPTVPALANDHALDDQGGRVARVGTFIYQYDSTNISISEHSPLTLPMTWHDESPSPCTAPTAKHILTVVNDFLVAYSVQRCTTTRIAPWAGMTILALSGNGRRALIAHATPRGNELALYAIDQAETCLARWPSRATECAALSYDGSEAILSGGDTTAEWVSFEP